MQVLIGIPGGHAANSESYCAPASPLPPAVLKALRTDPKSPHVRWTWIGCNQEYVTVVGSSRTDRGGTRRTAVHLDWLGLALEAASSSLFHLQAVGEAGRDLHVLVSVSPSWALL